VDFTVRLAQDTDARAISTLIRELGLFRRLEDEAPETTAFRVTHHLGQCLADDSHSVLVAESSDGRLAGYLSVHWLPYLFLRGPEGYVSELFVCEHDRGNGVGTELLDTAIREARRRGCARLMLAAVRTRDSYERGFYTERGWMERSDVANMVYEL
jgi:GNAT superfamily N-acetyltransferase